MLIHMFRGPDRIFAFTTDPSGANLPEKFAPWTAFKSVELLQGVHTPGVDADECLRDIEEYGLHVTDAHSRITHEALI